MKLKSPTKVEVRPSPGKGLGVFATQNIKAFEIIEDCALIFLPIEPHGEIPDLLVDYRFNYPPGVLNWTHQVLPLGFGCIYNHSNNRNTEWILHPHIPNVFRFRAIRDIRMNEECCTYYGNAEFR